MKLVRLASAVLALAAPLALAQTSTWKTDPAHSEVDFTIKHMAISNVHGRFGTVDATLTWDEADPTKSTVNATIDVTGVDTGVAARDNDLKGAKYFDTANHPQATFSSTSVTKTASGLKVNGNLTIKGVTKPVVLEVDGPSGPMMGMGKKMHMGFEATTTVNREDFGIGAGMPAAMLGDDVKLTIDLDFVKQ
ncbi:MAG: YceI family protein [Acidobacteriota bacterium]